MTRTSTLISALLALTILAPRAALAGGSIRLHLARISTGCIDDANGWYVARTEPSPRHGYVRLRVIRVLFGPRRRWIPSGKKGPPLELRRPKGMRRGLRVVVRTPVQFWREGGLGGCQSLFWEGEYGYSVRTFPGDPTRRLPVSVKSEDMFHHRLAYLTAYFAARADPTLARIVADLRSGNLQRQLAASDILKSMVHYDPVVFRTLGPALTPLVAHRPAVVSSGAEGWSQLGVLLSFGLEKAALARRHALAVSDTHTAPPLPAWCRGAERALLAWTARDSAAYLVSGEALRAVGFKLDPKRPQVAQLNRLREKLGMKPMPPGTKLVYRLSYECVPGRTRRGLVMPEVRRLNSLPLRAEARAKTLRWLRENGWRPIKRNGRWTIVPLVQGGGSSRSGNPPCTEPEPLRLPRASVMPTVQYLNRHGVSQAEQAKIEQDIRRTGWKLVRRGGKWTIVPLLGPPPVHGAPPPSSSSPAPVPPAPPSPPAPPGATTTP